jgi:hypothetical protein
VVLEKKKKKKKQGQAHKMSFTFLIL